MTDILFSFLRRAGQAGVLALAASLACLHYAARANLSNSDLGRHLMNGELFWTQGRILATNYYSYTQPDFPSICHHWLSGVVFKALYDQFGIGGLSAFYTILLTAGFLVFILAAAAQSRFVLALAAGLAVLPLTATRTEIRPEGFSTLLVGIFFWILNEYRRGKLDFRWVFCLLPLQVFWVNAHIFFFLGIFICGVFTAHLFINEGDSRRFRNMAVATLLVAAVSLLNPFGLAGLLEPFSIFKDYGYELAENQSVFFMMKRFSGTRIYIYMLLASAVLLFLWGAVLWVTRSWRACFMPLVLTVIFLLMGLKTNRAMAMFALVFIPLAAMAAGILLDRLSNGIKISGLKLAGVAAGVLMFCGLAVPESRYSPLRKFTPFMGGAELDLSRSFLQVLARPKVWAGELPGTASAAAFFRAAGMQGPVFNNYDVGGYLIFYLYPSQKVFVDNRPESYPVEFFKEQYIPMQENDEQWKRAAKAYGFETIFFYRHDQTPWAQPFLIRRIDDPAWAPVYVDDFMIILARRGGVNRQVIAAHELPRGMFGVVKP